MTAPPEWEKPQKSFRTAYCVWKDFYFISVKKGCGQNLMSFMRAALSRSFSAVFKYTLFLQGYSKGGAAEKSRRPRKKATKTMQYAQKQYARFVQKAKIRKMYKYS